MRWVIFCDKFVYAVSIDGYLNIDQVILGGTDMLYDITKPLPFNDQTVEIIELHDVYEHFGESNINNMMNDWFRLLIPGGRVMATLPDIDELTKKYIESEGEQKAFFLRSIYGIEGDHKAGYTKQSIRDMFEAHKFTNIEVGDWIGEPKKDDCPRLYVVAEKPL
jgi:predicted SAM-dependent methyltransferase